MKLNKLSTAIAAAIAATMVQSLNGGKPAFAVSLTGLTNSNTLVFFDSATPGTTTSRAVSGVSGSLVGIDYRPANGQLYGVSSANQIYTIDPTTGAATLVSNITPLTFNGGFDSGFDFNPVPDRLRLVGSNDQNFRINVDTGAIADFDPATSGTQPDANLAYAAGDANAGANPNITASAYTNSFPGTTSTTLYNIDSNLDILVTQNPPNAGTLNTVGSLGVNVGATGGFDIFATNTAFAAFDSNLYSINLSTGSATSLGAIGGSPTLVGLAATPVPFEASPTFGLLLVGGWAGVSRLKNRKNRAKLPLE